jgi:hypothetical protein
MTSMAERKVLVVMKTTIWAVNRHRGCTEQNMRFSVVTIPRLAWHSADPK